MTIEEMQRKLLSLIADKANLKKELEVYKKALDLAIQTNDMVRDEEKWKALLLKEAREENESR